MKKYFLIFATLSVLALGVGCKGEDSYKMTDDYPTDYDITYGLGHVYQYDPMNINGIDIVKRLGFFATLRLTLHFEGGKVVAATYEPGEVPFTPYDFEVPAGRFECVLDTQALPNVLRIVGTDHVIAYYKNGSFVVPFQLDSKVLNYEYTFENIE